MSQVINITGDGNYDFFPARGANEIAAFGSFGGGTITMHILNDDETDSAPISGTTFNAKFSGIYRGDPRLKLRVTMTGSTSPDLTIYVGAVYE